MNSESEKPEYDENGLIKRICMKPRCNQPLWVREYREFTPEKPLLCPECWGIVSNCANIKIEEFSHKNNNIPIDCSVRKKFDEQAIRDWINKGS